VNLAGKYSNTLSTLSELKIIAVPALCRIELQNVKGSDTTKDYSSNTVWLQLLKKSTNVFAQNKILCQLINILK